MAKKERTDTVDTTRPMTQQELDARTKQDKADTKPVMILLQCPVNMGSTGVVNPYTDKVTHFSPDKKQQMKVPDWAARILMGNQGCTRAG